VRSDSLIQLDYEFGFVIRDNKFQTWIYTK